MADDTYGAHESGAHQNFRERVESAADAQKQRAADGLGSAAAAARDTSNRLRGESEFVASWVSAAGDQLQALADRLRDRKPGELIDELSQFARERPGVFLGGAFVLGLGVARLLKSTPNNGADHGRFAWDDEAEMNLGGSGSVGEPTPVGAADWTPQAVS